MVLISGDYQVVEIGDCYAIDADDWDKPYKSYEKVGSWPNGFRSVVNILVNKLLMKQDDFVLLVTYTHTNNYSLSSYRLVLVSILTFS